MGEGLSSGASLLWRAEWSPGLIEGRDFFPARNPPSRTRAGRLCGSGGSAGELRGSCEGRLGWV